MDPVVGPSTPDEVLVERSAANDGAAFGELVARHHADLDAVARSVVGPERAEDVRQTALLKAFTALRKGEKPRNVGTWLASIVWRTAVSDTRRKPPEPVAIYRGRAELRRRVAVLSPLPLLLLLRRGVSKVASAGPGGGAPGVAGVAGVAAVAVTIGVVAGLGGGGDDPSGGEAPSNGSGGGGPTLAYEPADGATGDGGRRERDSDTKRAPAKSEAGDQAAPDAAAIAPPAEPPAAPAPPDAPAPTPPAPASPPDPDPPPPDDPPEPPPPPPGCGGLVPCLVDTVDGLLHPRR